jgi:tetratricopeptide (TPR) repeat protein
VTQETFNLTQDLFEFKALGQMAVKGKEKPLPVYKLISAKEAIFRPRLGSERMIYSEMIGRNNQLDRLERQVLKAVNGQGSIVSIIGEAGIGKSRLVAELKNREVMKQVAFFEGRAISIGRILSFHPIIDVLRQWARIREDDGEAMALGKLEAAVRELYPEDVGEVLPFVGTLMGMKLSGRYKERVKSLEGEALEKLILRTVRELIIRAAQLTPLVIVAEDLHWADTSSIELLESLFRLTETQRILFINVLRPGHKETGDRILETLAERFAGGHVEIVLEPLDERMSEALISNMLHISRHHHAFIGQTVQRAGGNPFFIEEVVRSFIDAGAIVSKHGTFEVTEKIRTMIVPHTINDVLMSRIDGLEEETRDLLKLASVIGRNFFYKVITDLPSSIEDIDGQLSYLQEIQLIQEQRRMDEVEYVFKHALAQETAYEAILVNKRKEIHLQVAKSIERVFDHRLHEFYGMLAFHYSRGENLEKAEEYLIKAGKEALRSSASNEALLYYQDALTLYLKKRGDAADPEKVTMLEKNIALALYNRGQYDEAVEYFDKALNFYWGKAPPNAISATFKFLSALLHFIVALYLSSLKFRGLPTQRDKTVADLFYKKCKALAIINPKRFFIESLYAYKEITNFDLTKFELGLQIFMGASALFSFTGISFRLSRKVLDSAKHTVHKANIRISIIYDLLETIHNFIEGNWKAIKDYDDALVNKNLDRGEIYDASQHLYWHGLADIYQGNFDRAESIVNKLDGIIEVYESDFSMLANFILKTNLLMERHKLADALSVVDEAIDFVQKTGFGLSLINVFSFKGRILTLMGNIEKAEKALLEANDVRSKVNAAPIHLSNFYRGQLEHDLYCLKQALGKGKTPEAAKYRKQAFQSAGMLAKISRKAAQYRTESYRLTGEYYWLIDKRRQALKWWNKAIEEGDNIGARLQLSRAYFDVGTHLLEADAKKTKLNEMQAEGYLKQAGVMFERMNLRHDLDKLSQVTAGGWECAIAPFSEPTCHGPKS